MRRLGLKVELEDPGFVQKAGVVGIAAEKSFLEIVVKVAEADEEPCLVLLDWTTGGEFVAG